MLTALTIRDFVLIEQLDLQPAATLTVLTGETGAGKSILLDALGAACGARAESAWVRAGSEKASITASFALSKNHPAIALVQANDIALEDELLLRRLIWPDGRSKAFINDQPVSVGLLRQTGALLLEVHGQFETHGLLDASTHRMLLDRFARVDLQPLQQTYSLWQAAQQREQQARSELASVQAQEQRLREDLAELAELAPQLGEEAQLLAEKQQLQHRSKLALGLQEALNALEGEHGAESQLSHTSRSLQKLTASGGERISRALAQLDTARDALAEAIATLSHLSAAVDEPARSLEQVEDRLYALRSVARRHALLPDALPELTATLHAQLERLSAGEAGIDALTHATHSAQSAYLQQAHAVSMLRQKAAKKLDKAVMAELAPLKLERAVFTTTLPPCPPGPDGCESAQFLIATNPGQPAGPLHKVASGGELARFMLALKVVLADTGSAATLIFDEVDQGVGGAVAAAVGERLARLAHSVQVLVVTHSPQVAATGDRHWRVSKHSSGKSTRTQVDALDAPARQEEIARMLAGETVTKASRAAAAALLKGHAA